MKNIKDLSPKNTTKEYDVVVVGGGIAGVIAACGAAASGASVLLAESSDFLGGVVTMGPLEALMTQYDSNRKVIGGLAQELVDSLRSLDAGARGVCDTTGYCGSIIPYQPEALKLILFRMLEKYGVNYVLGATLSAVGVDVQKLENAEFQTRFGTLSTAAKAFVDCSGSGILAYLAGNDIMLGDENGISQPVTVLSRWGGVDLTLLRDYVAEHPADFRLFDGIPQGTDNPLHLWGFSGALREGWEQGALSLKREEMHLMESTAPGEVIVNFSRVSADPYDPLAMSRARYLCSEQVLELLEWFKKTIPAFSDARIVQSGYLGIRESGRVKGRYVLTRDDIVSGGDRENSIAMGAFPIDIHRSDEGMSCERILKGYHIAAEALMAESVSNLFMGGRCISSSFEANASCRISVTCMATGHAAGVMAAEYAADSESFSIANVQSILSEQGAILF